MKEIWKNIKGYKNKYVISNFGRVKSLSRKVWNGHNFFQSKEKILKTYSKARLGYVVVSLSKKNKRKTKRIHRLVAQAFIENSNNKPQINHKNGIKTDNKAVNLEWCTAHENLHHAWKTNLLTQTKYKRKLSKQKVLEIRKKYIPWKYSIYKLSKEYNIHFTTVHNIITRRI